MLLLLLLLADAVTRNLACLLLIHLLLSIVAVLIVLGIAHTDAEVKLLRSLILLSGLFKGKRQRKVCWGTKSSTHYRKMCLVHEILHSAKNRKMCLVYEVHTATGSCV